MVGKSMDGGYGNYWNAYCLAQRMSFFRFLIYGWWLGILGWIVFTVIFPLVWCYFVFYTFRWTGGAHVTKYWHRFNTRRAFGAYVTQVDCDRIEEIWNSDKF